MTAPEPFVSHHQAAEHLGVPPSWLYSNAEKLGVPRYRIGPRQYRYKLSELDGWLHSQAQ